MGFRCGIVGLPNVGKSTIFNALSASRVAAENYPFCTIEPNHAVVAVPDARLEILARLAKSAKTVPTMIEFVDIAGLVKGASSGEGLGNQFLSHIREVDAIIHVVRCFEDGQVTHVYETLSPKRDVEVIETELQLADLEMVERRLERVSKAVKVGEKSLQTEAHVLSALRDALSQGKDARTVSAAPELFSALGLITTKPVLFVANVHEDDLQRETESICEMRVLSEARNARLLFVTGKLESELNELSFDERRTFLEALGLERTSLEALVVNGYKLLDLITFFTANEREAHAWTCRRGTMAIDAAAKVHTDFARGFIRAEVISFDDYRAYGGENGARDKGVLRIEGREYVMRDGDVINIRFNI